MNERHGVLEILACWVGCVFALVLTCPQVRAACQIDRLSYSAGYVTIEFSDPRLLIDPNLAHALEYSQSIHEPGPWTNIYSMGATFSSLGGDRRMVILSAPNTSGFYRIGVDTDGDGLSDGMEAKLGTDPGKADSDGDGYSDIIEIANGTLATDALSRPLRGVQPGVQFCAPSSQALEGAGTIFIPVEFDRFYSGQLYYSVSPMCTASNGGDFLVAEPGVVTVNGLSATIPIEIKDDLEIEEVEAIVLELNDDLAGTYHTGAFSTHTVLLMDNDANWSGLLESPAGETGFRLLVLRSNAYTAAMLVPSPKSGAGHLGGQIIPAPPPGQNGWPVTNLQLTASQFTGESVPVPAGSSRLLGQVPMARRFSFSAVPPPPGEANLFYVSKTNASLGPLVIGGQYVEVLASSAAGATALQLTNPGYFVLAREVRAMPSLPIPTTAVKP